MPKLPNASSIAVSEADARRAGLFALIEDLVMRHSPSGDEREVDAFLEARFDEMGVAASFDAAGNLIAKVKGRGQGALAITAHKDEIGAIVTAVLEDGRLKVRKLGGSFPWIWGEGVLDVLGEQATVQGILSFGSRHVSHLSPQFACKETKPLKWEDVWIETKQTPADLAETGVRPGTRVVIGKHRKAPFRLGDHIASYTLDNKASLAILLGLAGSLHDPAPDVYLVATSMEEVGAVGALHFTRHTSVDALIALEICPIAPEYSVADGPTPVLLAEDSHGLYDIGLTSAIRSAGERAGIATQTAVLNGFGSDGSIAMKAGHVARAACIGFATQNTHGYEVAHLDAIANCQALVEAMCREPLVTPTRSNKGPETP